MKSLPKSIHVLLNFLIIIAILICCLNTPLYAETTTAHPEITVCAENCDFATIQAAINDPDTQAGVIITMLDAVHTEAGIVINKDITIQGQDGRNPSVIQAHTEPDSAKNRVFLVEQEAHVIFRNLIIRHGRAPHSYPPSGGAICNYGNLVLEDCVITNNRATDGGGILNKGVLSIKNCTISNNIADGIHPDAGLSCGAGGGIKSEGGTLTLVNSRLHRNEAGESGGGLFVACKSTVKVVNSTITENTAREDGGGIRIRGTLFLTNSTISQNKAIRLGGGICIHGHLEFSNNIIANNSDKDCFLVTEHPYKGVGTIVTNTNNLIADQSCDADYHGDPKSGPEGIGASMNSTTD